MCLCISDARAFITILVKGMCKPVTQVFSYLMTVTVTISDGHGLSNTLFGKDEKFDVTVAIKRSVLTLYPAVATRQSTDE